MKVLLLVTSAGYSFTNQATALQQALKTKNIEAELCIVRQEQPDFARYKDFLVVPVGAWNDFDRIVRPPLEAGCRVLPWLVADAAVRDFIQDLNRLPFFLTTSQYAKEIFVRDGVSAEKIRVLYECVDEDLWRPPTNADLEQAFELFSIDEDERGDQLPESFRLRYAKQHNIPVLFTMGRPTNKGVPEIMQALAKLGQNTPWIYFLKGWASPTDFAFGKQELELAEKLGVYPRIRYLSGEFGGQFMRLLLQVCDIYVSAAHSESFGLPLVEAQYCGKMVVTYKATSTQETVVHEQTGLLAAADSASKSPPSVDVADLAKQLERALADQTLRSQLSGAARTAAVARFGKDAISTQFLHYAGGI